jgi:hypothetical protein
MADARASSLKAAQSSNYCQNSATTDSGKQGWRHSKDGRRRFRWPCRIVAPVMQIMKRHGARYANKDAVIGPISTADGGPTLAQYACARHMCTGAVHVLLVHGIAWALVPRIEAGSRACFPVSSHGVSRVLSVAATSALLRGVIQGTAESELS